MPEVAGTAACYVTPTSVDDIKEGIKKVYYNDEYRNQLIENGKEELKRFSWQKSARDCWTVFNNYLK
jgi:glycosyltransferase involved in cell wall biosynthesis